MAPKDGELVSRSYREDTFVLDSVWRTPTGAVQITEFMPKTDDEHYDSPSDLVRTATCLEGHVVIEHDFRVRFSYGESVPWVRKVKVGDGVALSAIAGPDAVYLTGPMLSPGQNKHHEGAFDIKAGERLTWTLTWEPSWMPPPEIVNPDDVIDRTEEFWRNFANEITCEGKYAGAVRRSLLVLRALTEKHTGGIVAAATTSLPEDFGGERNWDYRYVWLRDSALTIEALMTHGLTNGAEAWRQWLLRAIAGDPENLRIMYGLGGERHLPEFELDHLPGYENSTPVRIGNGAADQFQGDVVGEVMVALEQVREAGVEEDEFSWGIQQALLDFATANFDRKEHGIWEMRGELDTFTHSRAMMWAAYDRGIKAVEKYGLPGKVDHWREQRDRLHEEIESQGWNDEINAYTQMYGSTEVDASLLQLAQIGYVDWEDPRMLSTVAKIEEDLLDDHGFLHRYRTESGKDGLEGDEYPFLICTFWLVTQYANSGRVAEAGALMDKLVDIASPQGLLAEEYSTKDKRLAGNYPQAFSHLGLVQAADALENVATGNK